MISKKIQLIIILEGDLMIRNTNKVEHKMIFENSYLKRYFKYMIKNNFHQTIDDFAFFSVNEIHNSEHTFRFTEGKMPSSFQSIGYLDRGNHKEAEFSAFMEASGTTAFIVIKDEKIVYENYFNGYNRESTSRVFSVTKSFTSALIGIAIDEGLIGCINDPIEKYIPEIKDSKTKALTIQNLLLMHSGIGYKEGFAPWTDDIKQYFSTDIRKRVLNLKTKDPVGQFFHYNDYHLQILGMIIERVTKKSVSDYFEEKIWKVLGTEYPALWVLDSSKTSLEKMESGLCARAIDLAKFGQLYLNNGQWQGQKIISEKWIKESTSFENINNPKEYFKYYQNKPWGRWFNSGKAYYKYLWWGYQIDADVSDFFAMGIQGQFIYVCPRKNALVVRLGKKWGVSGWWPSMIKEIIDKI